MHDHQDGSLDYCIHASILTSLKDYRIFTQGNVATDFISTILPCGDVWDIQEISMHKYPAELAYTNCGILHNSRYCSLAKLWHIRGYLAMHPLPDHIRC